MSVRRVAVTVTVPVTVEVAVGATLRRPQPDRLVWTCSSRVGDAAVVVDLPAYGGVIGRDGVGPWNQEQEGSTEGKADG